MRQREKKELHGSDFLGGQNEKAVSSAPRFQVLIHSRMSSVSKLLLHSLQAGRMQRRRAEVFTFTIINDAIFALSLQHHQSHTLHTHHPRLPPLSYCALRSCRCFPPAALPVESKRQRVVTSGCSATAQQLRGEPRARSLIRLCN